MPSKHPIVVYHVAGMGDWKDVVDEQLAMLTQVGLTSNVRITYLGKELAWLEDRLIFYEIDYVIVRSDPNTDHCETFAMMEIDRLAKEEQVTVPILYFHTKGVSNPGNTSKRDWRHLMEAWVVRRWRVNLSYLSMYDAVGVNWIQGGAQHFSGTFWIANPDWIRKLPKFESYHNSNGLHRYTCEMWIGAAQWCKALSLGCKDEPFWNFGYDYTRWMPKNKPAPNRTADPVTWESSFKDIFKYFNCDKDTDHTYGEVYDTLFPNHSRNDVKFVFEIGVQAGRSLQAWEVAFQNSLVYGIDVSDSVESLGQRTHVGMCNSTKPRCIWEIMDRWGLAEKSLDLIIDDGSHLFKDQLATGVLMRPYLTETGVYVIEDIYPAHGAAILAKELGGIVVDRRGIHKRFDDVLVVVGSNPEVLKKLQDVPREDIPTLFPGDEF